MNQLNSFTSSSDNMNLRRVGGAIYVAAWVVIGLVVIDILINLVLAFRQRSFCDTGKCLAIDGAKRLEIFA